MNSLKENMAILEERFPGITGHLEEAASKEEKEENEGKGNPEACKTAEIVRARNGEFTGKIGKRYLHSAFRPSEEAERLVRKELAESIEPVIFEGFGLGYQVEALLRQSPERLVVIIEPSARRFLTALETRPMKELLSSHYLSLAVGTEPDGIEQLLSHLGSSTIRTFRLRPLIESCGEEFAPYQKAISSFLNRKEVNSATLDRFALTWTRNLLKNRRVIGEAQNIDDLKGFAEGLPLLLLAAGPSLDSVLEYYEELSKRMVVIAVDTAARALALRGFQADFLVVVDPQYWNSRHLDRIDLGKTLLVSESSTHPAVFRRSFRGIYFCGSFFPLGIALEEVLGRNGKLDAGGSVATSAFSLARHLGAKEIYIAGLDLGYPGGKTHFAGSFFEHRGHSLSHRTAPFEHFTHRIIHDAGTIPIPAADGGTIRSDYRLSVYRDWFASRIKRFPEPRVFTITPDSAAIEGMKCCSIKKLLELEPIANRKDSSLTALHALSKTEIEQRREKMESWVLDLQAELRRMHRLAKKALELSKDSFTDGRISISPALTEIERQLLASSSKDLLSFLIQPFLRDFENSGSSEDSSNALEIHQQSLRLYREIAETASHYLTFFS